MASLLHVRTGFMPFGLTVQTAHRLRRDFMKTFATSGAVLAAAALGFAIAGATLAVPASAASEIKCAGINACKGHSECNTATSSCKGQNACKGQGWLPTASKAECVAKGGKVI
jgi:uncharacterized membrane protein